MPEVEVQETQDAAVAQENTPDNYGGSGEISVADVQGGNTREKATGKKINSSASKPMAQRPETETVVNAPSGAQSPDIAGNAQAYAQRNMIEGKTHSFGDSEKLVKIRLKEFKTCKIGPRWYEFKQGHVYDVPENVKEVLRNAGVLDVL